MVEEEDDEMMTMITKAKAAPDRSRKAFNAVKMLMEENFSVETIQNSSLTGQRGTQTKSQAKKALDVLKLDKIKD